MGDVRHVGFFVCLILVMGHMKSYLGVSPVSALIATAGGAYGTIWDATQVSQMQGKSHTQ